MTFIRWKDKMAPNKPSSCCGRYHVHCILKDKVARCPSCSLCCDLAMFDLLCHDCIRLMHPITAQVTFYLIVQFLWFISIQDNFSDINGNIVSVSAHYHVKQSWMVAHPLLDFQLELDHSGEKSNQFSSTGHLVVADQVYQNLVCSEAIHLHRSLLGFKE